MSTNPHTFRKSTAHRGYEVIEKATGAPLGSVDRISPEHVKLQPKWRATDPDGTVVGSHYPSRNYAAQELADRAIERAAAAEYATAETAPPPGPEYAYRGDTALRIMAENGDTTAATELARRRAEERAAWDRQYARGNKPAEPPTEAPTCILTGMAGENDDDCTTHEHEPAEAPTPPRLWSVTFTETTTYRVTVPAVDLPEGDDYADRQAAALLDMARDAIGDGAVIVTSGAAFVMAEPVGPVPGSFHDPRVTCCGRDAADCDCTETCERCGETFDPEQAGTTDHHSGISLCADCTANNADRVVL